MITLYRPVGFKELRLIAESGFRAFPPRLPEQPFFYPVLSAEYAKKIASEWNTKDEFSEYIGCVVQFDVDDEILKQFQELQVPAEKLAEFNCTIVGTIKVIETFIGEKAIGAKSDDWLSDTKEDEVTWLRDNSLTSDWHISHCEFIPEPDVMSSFEDLAASYLDRENDTNRWHKIIHYSGQRFSFGMTNHSCDVGVWNSNLSLEASIYKGYLKPETKEFISREFKRICDLMIARKCT